MQKFLEILKAYSKNILKPINLTEIHSQEYF